MTDDDVSSTVSLLRALRERLLGVMERDDNPVSTTMEWTQLSTAIAKVSGELRAYERLEVQRISKLRPELVLEYFRTLGEAERLHLLRELTAAASGASVLA